MTAHFTLRDFFVYFLTGIILTFCIILIFPHEILGFLDELFFDYEFLSEFPFLITMFVVPVMYSLGHLVGRLNFILLEWHKHKGKKDDTPTYIYQMTIAYAVKKYRIKERNDSFKGTNFWEKCAILQQKGSYQYAERWYVLTDFFSAITVVFLISAIVAFVSYHCCIGIIYIFLSFISYRRTKQFAKNFVSTVNLHIKTQSESKK